MFDDALANKVRPRDAAGRFSSLSCRLSSAILAVSLRTVISMALAASGEWVCPFFQARRSRGAAAVAGARGRRASCQRGCRGRGSAVAAAPSPFRLAAPLTAAASFPTVRNTMCGPGRRGARVRVRPGPGRRIGGWATIGAPSSRAGPGTGPPGKTPGPGHQQVRFVEQLEVLDVSADATVEEHQVEVADLRLIGLLLEQPDVAARMLFPAASAPPPARSRWTRSGTCRYQPGRRRPLNRSSAAAIAAAFASG